MEIQMKNVCSFRVQNSGRWYIEEKDNGLFYVICNNEEPGDHSLEEDVIPRPAGCFEGYGRGSIIKLALA